MAIENIEIVNALKGLFGKSGIAFWPVEGEGLAECNRDRSGGVFSAQMRGIEAFDIEKKCAVMAFEAYSLFYAQEVGEITDMHGVILSWHSTENRTATCGIEFGSGKVLEIGWVEGATHLTREIDFEQEQEWQKRIIDAITLLALHGRESEL